MLQEKDQILPLISFIVPSYNAEKYIELCLSSIEGQIYPKEKIEILVVDGGSVDRTLEIAKRFSVKIVHNPNRIAEFAKSIGIKKASGKYLVILDTDNEIVQKDWLIRNISPLENDASLLGMDSVFLVKKDDFLTNRYCALLGLEDPLVRYMADLASNSDIEEYSNHAVYKVKNGRFPIFGSNGFIWRKNIFDEIGGFVPRYDEAEFCMKVLEHGFGKIGFVREVGIYHHHVENIWQFLGKRIRRGNEFMSRKLMTKDSLKIEVGVWLDKYKKREFLKSAFLCLSIIYPTYESVRGYLRDRDSAWFLHPLFSFLTVIVYGFVFVRFTAKQYRTLVIKLINSMKRI